MLLMFKNLPDFEVYYVEHRGVGRSSRIGCVAPQAETPGSDGGVTITPTEFPECAKEFNFTYGPAQQAYFFSTTLAAQDLAQLIRLTKADKEVYVYGISYGTYWANRFMQIDETEKQVRAVILDGVVLPSGPDRTHIDEWDVKMDQVGKVIMEKCAHDSFCSSKMQVDPAIMVQTVFEKLYVNNSCSAITSDSLNRSLLTKILGTFLIQTATRNFIPALLYRLNRCDPDHDFGAIKFFLDVIQANSSRIPNCVPLASSMLGSNIMLAELFDPTRTVEELQAIFNASYFATGPGIQYRSLYPFWPVYTPDAYFNQSFSTQFASVLLLNGDLDPQTPFEYAQEQYERIVTSSPNQKHLIKIPFAPHYTVMRSPVNNSKIDCGMQLVLEFLNDPSKRPDDSCTQFVEPINFRGYSRSVNELAFGVHDIFDGVYVKPEPELTVNLYLFIGVEAATCVLGIIVICCLIYYAVKLREERKQANEQYNDLDAS